MAGMEYETLDSILGNGGRLHYYLIAQNLRISSHYAYVICKGLERNGYVDFNGLRGICNLTGKGKDTVERNWLFKLKSHRENLQKVIKENRERISRNIETINY